MDSALPILSAWGTALLQLALNPFYYIGLLLVALLYRRQVALERRMFYARLHAPAGQWAHALLAGLLGGLLISAAVSMIGLIVNLPTMIWLWAATLILGLLRVRYLCMVYAAGVVIVLHELAALLPVIDAAWLEPVIGSLERVHPPSLLALVALLHALEALLVRQRDGRSATALISIGKRGKPVGLYEHHGLWAVPLFVVVPASGAAGIGQWWPWPFALGGAEWSAGWTLMALPLMIGMTGLSSARLPQLDARALSARLALFAVVAGALAVVAALWPTMAVAAAVVAAALHELLAVLQERHAKKGTSYFAAVPHGLRIFAVVPGSPAAQLGVASGEVIVKANGVPVRTKEQLHAALRANSAFCKLEIADLNNESRFVQRALFDGDHHQLGIVLSPDEDAPHHMPLRPLSVLSLISPGVRSRRAEAAPETAEGATVDQSG